MIDLMYRRPDGTFVIQHGGHPYHVTQGDALFPAVAAAAEGVTLPPEPVPEAVVLPQSRVFTVLEFRDRLTPEEELAITEAGMVSAAVRVWLDRLAGAQTVDLDDPRTIGGLQQMVGAGLLTAPRMAEILA